MTGLKVGYLPLSVELSSPGDRRRLVYWAKARGHTLVTDLSQKVDVLVASERTDFQSPIFDDHRTPVVFDLVDAYLSPLSVYDDLGRSIAKRASGQLSGPIKKFSEYIGNFCARSNAVVCSSVEQEILIRQFNSNTHVILDFHEEIPLINTLPGSGDSSRIHTVMWEGLPATIGGVRFLSTTLTQLAATKNLLFEFVTDEVYYKYLGKYIKKHTSHLLKQNLSQIQTRINVVPWSPENLVTTARKSSVAMIPIDLSIPMQKLKPENRLLIMWRLGLPCLTSPSPAYSRVAELAGVNAVCLDEKEWLKKFHNLLENPEFAHQEVVRGQNYIMQYHSREILLRKWDRAIESVV